MFAIQFPTVHATLRHIPGTSNDLTHLIVLNDMVVEPVCSYAYPSNKLMAETPFKLSQPTQQMNCACHDDTH